MLRKVLLFIISILLIGTVKLGATNEPDKVLVVSGQVVNKNDGTAVDNHKVCIVHYKSRTGENDYFKEVFTDEDGFYTDTVVASWEKGSLYIYTLDNDLNKIDTTITFRFFKNFSLTYLVNFRIDMPVHTNLINPQFKYAQKQGGNKFYFRFIDLTKNQNIVIRKWSFGDGTFSTLKNPDHIYDAPGIYRVKLTVQTIYSGKKIVNSYSKMLFIPYRDYYHIGGQVFANSFPIDVGKAFLYFKDSANTFIPVDTVVFDTLGYYIFYDLPQGEYIIKAQPCEVSKYYGKVCPTYFGNCLKWQNADICEIDANCWDYDINLMEGVASFTGNGSINGNILIVDNGLKHYGVGSGENITIYLFDKEENNMNYLYTGKDGVYNFNDLDFGQYKLYPEVTGVTTPLIPIEINEANPVAEDVVIELSLENSTYVIPNSAQDAFLFKNIYPNPVSQGLNVVITIKTNKLERVTISIHDLMGNQMSRQTLMLQTGINKVQLETDRLHNGIFMVSIENTSGKTDTHKLIVSKQH